MRGAAVMDNPETTTIESKELLKKATAAAEALLRKAADASETLLNKATETSEALRCAAAETEEGVHTNSIEAADMLLLAASRASKALYADSAEAAQLLLCTAAEVADTAEADENNKASIAEAVESARELLYTAADNAKTLIAEAVKTAVKLLGDTAVETERLRRNAVNCYLVELRNKAEAALIEITSEAESAMMAMGSKSLVHELRVQKLELEMQNQELQDSSAEVEKLQEYFADFYDFSPTGFVSIDLNGAINHTNITCAKLLGRERSQLIGAIFASFVTMVDRPVFNNFLQQLFEGGTRQTCILSLYDREQTRIFVQMVGTLSPDKQSCRAVLIDLTEQRQREEQLRQSQKMEAIGQLAGGVAHDFNNILSVIIGYASLMQMDKQLDDPQQERVKAIASSAEKAAQLTKGLLAFSRKQAMVLRNSNLNDIVLHVENFLARIIGDDINLTSIRHAQQLPVNVDSGQIEQVLINLATNARDAMQNCGSLTIEAGMQEIGASFVGKHGYGEPGRYAHLKVSDTGSGMDKDTCNKIFDPFFTTKEVGKGTGLGLAIAYGIVKQHNGFIEVYSELGQGTTFRIYLPLIELEQPVREVNVALQPPQGGTETILVAEDNADVRKLVVTVLTKFGYDVIQAIDGQEAVDMFAAHRDRIRLILMDMIMPRKNGRDAYEEIIRTHSVGVKVLYLSGYTADFIQNRGISEEGIELLMKPVQPLELLRKIREMLDSK
ncbi:MAG: response regulator [Desulfuromonadales bacterium]|nr:response regulator [Desulfuromonadales bacterium]